MTGYMPPSKSDEWGTPPEVYDPLDAEFHFTLDPAASDANHKCDKYYTIEDDGLAQPWAPYTVFLNPPYGRAIVAWIKKAYEESRWGATVVALLPARTDTRWFHDYVLGKAEIRFIKGRVKFLNEQGERTASAPFPSMIVIWRPPATFSTLNSGATTRKEAPVSVFSQSQEIIRRKSRLPANKLQTYRHWVSQRH